jgi:poly(A) polymerase
MTHKRKPAPTWTRRDFATEVVRQLREAGYEAYWAGGCVRDELLGLEPKDYDVATSARPEEVRRVFRRYHTLSVGVAFGVVVVVGPKSAGTVDVATFRRDTTYSDGRRPDAVVFCSAREDALRRDFTINGLFYDPLENRVIDFVGGQQDIENRLVRAIGDPEERFAEDKLRMLRAIRFATTFSFQIESQTWQAVCHHAPEIVQVSVERITAELRRIFEHRNRARGTRLLAESGLLSQILPEGVPVYGWPPAEAPSVSQAQQIQWHSGSEDNLPKAAAARWEETLAILDALAEQPDAALAIAVLLRYICRGASQQPLHPSRIGRRWRLSLREMELVELALLHEPLLLEADRRRWPDVQRVLALPSARRLLEYAAAVSRVTGKGAEGVSFCQRTLERPIGEWNPPPLITGDDLKQLGLPPGPVYKCVLEQVRDAQLEGRVKSLEEAREFARKCVGQHPTSGPHAGPSPEGLPDGYYRQHEPDTHIQPDTLLDNNSTTQGE